MTATHPTYRRRGWPGGSSSGCSTRSTRTAVTEAWTGNDSTNAAMLAVNQQLGYVTAATSIRLARRLAL